MAQSRLIRAVLSDLKNNNKDQALDRLVLFNPLTGEPLSVSQIINSSAPVLGTGGGGWAEPTDLGVINGATDLDLDGEKNVRFVGTVDGAATLAPINLKADDWSEWVVELTSDDGSPHNLTLPGGKVIEVPAVGEVTIAFWSPDGIVLRAQQVGAGSTGTGMWVARASLTAEGAAATGLRKVPASALVRNSGGATIGPKGGIVIPAGALGSSGTPLIELAVRINLTNQSGNARRVTFVRTRGGVDTNVDTSPADVDNVIGSTAYFRLLSDPLDVQTGDEYSVDIDLTTTAAQVTSGQLTAKVW